MAGQWSVTACIRHRARIPDPAGRLLDASADQVAGRVRIVAGAGSASGVGTAGDQPAQRARLNVEPAGRCAGQLAGRTDPRLVMELSVEAIWLAMAAVDMLRASTGGHCTYSRRWGARLATTRPTLHLPQSGVLGRYRRMDVPAPPAPGPLHLTTGGRSELADPRRAVAVAGGRRGLAAPVAPPVPAR